MSTQAPSPRWIADLKMMELSECQPDNSYKPAYRIEPLLDGQVERLRTALDRIRYVEGCPRSIERIALEALGVKQPETKP